MRNPNKILHLLLLTFVLSQVTISCKKEIDYSSITYKNYLRYEIQRASAFLLTVTEGSSEGEYLPGSMAAYQSAIDLSELVSEDSTVSQHEIDKSFKNLLQAGEDFYDKMVPFKSGFEDLISYAQFTLGWLTEGTGEGNVKPGSKAALQSVINKSISTLNRTDLVQRMIDADRTELLNAIYTFDGNTIGKANVFVNNFSFENPGYNTSDFGQVEGWKLFGKLETWAPPAQIYQGGTEFLPLESVPDGQFVARIGSYTQGVYQTLVERIHPNVRYTLDFKASLLENYEDAFGNRYKAVILSRVVVFDREPGDYRFSNIISQSYDTLGIDPSGFIEIKRDIDISGSSEFIEKNMSVDFLIRHSFDATKPIWAECYVALDDVKVSRKSN